MEERSQEPVAAAERANEVLYGSKANRGFARPVEESRQNRGIGNVRSGGMRENNVVRSRSRSRTKQVVSVVGVRMRVRVYSLPSPDGVKCVNNNQALIKFAPPRRQIALAAASPIADCCRFQDCLFSPLRRCPDGRMDGWMEHRGWRARLHSRQRQKAEADERRSSLICTCRRHHSSSDKRDV